GQQAPSARYEIDLDDGTITVTNRAPKHTSAYERFIASVPSIPGAWREDASYDLAALKRMTAPERRQIVAMLSAGDMTWREVEALSSMNTAEAKAALGEASKHHLSIDTRLAAADVMYRKKRLRDDDEFIARQIRLLSDPRNGLERALAIAEQHPSDTVKQALLWASYNATECAPHCAALLLKMT